MSSYPITYPVTRAVTYPPARALLGRAGTPAAPTPPTLSAASVAAFTDATSDISVSTDKSTGTLYWVIDTSATPPSAAQVKLGQGSGGGVAPSAGSQAVIGSGTQSKTGASGLSENTAYYAYFMHETAVGQSSVAGTPVFTTYYTASQAVFASFSAAPATARKTAINTLIGSLKTANVWNALDVLYITASADSQAAAINWKAPASFTAIPVNSPTFVADRGFTGDGSTSRVRTQFTPSVNGSNYVLNSASAWAWVNTNAQLVVPDIGSATAPRTFITSRNTSDQFVLDANAGTTGTAGSSTSSIGFFGAQRISSATKRGWKNGVQVGTDIASASTGVANQEQWFCGANATSFSTKQICAAAWGASLSGLELSFYNAMLAYMQTVGAA